MAGKIKPSVPRPRRPIPDPFTYDENSMLSLDVAVRIVFKDGSLGVPGLRKERDNGNLEVFKIAGREFVNILEISRMRVRCRYDRRHLGGELDEDAEREALELARQTIASERKTAERLRDANHEEDCAVKSEPAPRSSRRSRDLL